jgi:hypothetical protein
MIANPLGYTPQELAQQTTSVNENFANAAKTAIGSAAAFAAAHGGADVGGGGTGAAVGQIGAQIAGARAGALSDIQARNAELKRQSMLTGLSELNQAGSAAGGAAGTGISGAGTTGGDVTSAGQGVTAAKQAGWQDVAGVLGAVGGGLEAATGFVNANPNGIFGG